MNPHFKALKPAYQLHFYFCFKTHCLQPLLAPQSAHALIEDVLADVCKREQYRLLETDVADDRLRLLLSLQPTQTVARAAKMLKGNLDREFFCKTRTRPWLQKTVCKRLFRAQLRQSQSGGGASLCGNASSTSRLQWTMDQAIEVSEF